MTLNPQLSNLLDTGRPVGTKDKAEYLGHEIIEQLAVFEIIILLAIGTGQILIIDTAYPYLAPLRFLIFMATGTFISQI